MTSIDILQQIIIASRENKTEIHKVLRKIVEDKLNDLNCSNADVLIGKGNQKKSKAIGKFTMILGEIKIKP